MMETVKGPLGVVSVAGMYRTGKSYLLNRVLLNRQRGFGVGPTINPCTKGIWMWGTPLSGTNQNGEPINIIIVDSEGLGGIDEENNHDMRIFSLAMLMSSYFVYNSMGQIDENAISNLSLVVNLTKHIQLSVSKEKDAGLDKVLPSFMWVVRDFSLQLEDEDGMEISQSDYLETVLKQQSSDPNDQKTQIRKCLIKYFPKRDCHTLVRPLVEEEKLQKLEEMEIDQLRAEFVEQVMHLRRKILANCPVKTVFGQAMDGETWSGLIVQYVQAINTGSVPNIESAWTQICRNKAQTSLSQVVDQFEREVAELGSPTSQSEFEKSLQDAERTAIKDLQKELTTLDSAMASEYTSKLKKHLKKRTQSLVTQNHQICQGFSQQMLVQLFTELDQIKQTCQEDPCSNSFQQVEYALREVSNYYDQNCCDFPEKHLYMAESKLQFMLDILSIQSHHAINQARHQQECESELKERHSAQVRNLKEEARTEQLRLEQLWKQAMQAKSEVEASSQIVTEQLNALKEQKIKESSDQMEAVSKLKRQMQDMKDDFAAKREKYEQQSADVVRRQKQSASEFEKEKALMKQKIDFLEKTLEEKATKEREYAVDWRTQKSGLTQEIKAISIKHEAELKSLLQQIDDEKDKSSDLETKLADKCQKFDQLTERMADLEASWKTQLSDAQATIKELQLSKNQIKQETMNQLSAKLQQAQFEYQTQRQLVDDLERRLKESSEQLLTATHDTRKQVAIKDQKIEFLDMQLKDLKDQLEESQRQHATMVAALNQWNTMSDDENDAREKLELLQKEFTALTQAHQKQVKDLNSEIATHKQALLAAEQSHKSSILKVEQAVIDAQEALRDAESQRMSLTEKIRLTEAAKQKLADELKQQEAGFKKRLENELGEREEQYKAEQRDVEVRHDEQITQLKSFYELEKEKIELRITEERDRAARRLTTYQEEQETRMREEFRDKESEIEYLQQQLTELEQHQASFTTQAEHEISLKQMQVEGLERQNTDLKERLNKLESNRNTAFDKQLEHFEAQRQELNSRIEKLMQDTLTKDKQIATLSTQLDRSNEFLDKRTAEFEATQSQLEHERLVLGDRCEQQKAALSEIQDEAMQAKLESGREIALLNQQIEFLNHKIEDLQRSSEESQRIFDDKLKLIRQDISEDSQAQVDRITQEKELWEQKYEQKRKALKEMEVQLGRKISELEKQSNAQQSQIQKSQIEAQNRERSLTEEIAKLQGQLLHSESGPLQGQLYGSVTTEELLSMKNTLTETERELSDLQSTYDRDKALWEGKVQFLESQKDNYKKDLIEAQRKFEITLDQLQKRGNQNKERQENSQQAIMKVLEQKYKAQIRELIETQQATANEQKDKTRRLESELASANERLSSQGKHKVDEVSMLEKKLQESKQNEARLHQSFLDLQSDTNRRLEELTSQLTRDKESYKSKLADADKRAKEAEQKRTQLLFSIEKERANWQLEEDHLRRKQAELEEFIQNLEKSKDSLKKENSKLRNDVRGTSATGVKKQFVFAKGAQHLLNQTQSVQGGIPPKGVKAPSQTDTSQDQTTSMGVSQGSILNTAINRLKENQNMPMQSKSPYEQSKQRQMASPDIMRMNQKSPLIMNRTSQQNIKPVARPPLISGSLSSYNVGNNGQDNLSNNGSAIGQGFKLNLPNRYNPKGATDDDK